MSRAISPSGPAAAVVGGSGGALLGRRVATAGSSPWPTTTQTSHAAQTVELADDEVLLPGLVDTHVHVNEPGRTEWEGFASATRAAAAGGVTTIVDMPLNSIPPTTTVANLRIKQEVAAGQVSVDVGFWGGAVPGNLRDLAPLHDAGVFGFKCFLLDSGVEEFRHLEPDQLAMAMGETARLGALMIVHAEDGRPARRGRPRRHPLRRLPGLPAGRGGGGRDRTRGRPGSSGPTAGPTSLHLSAAGRRTDVPGRPGRSAWTSASRPARTT